MLHFVLPAQSHLPSAPGLLRAVSTLILQVMPPPLHVLLLPAPLLPMTLLQVRSSFFSDLLSPLTATGTLMRSVNTKRWRKKSRAPPANPAEGARYRFRYECKNRWLDSCPCIWSGDAVFSHGEWHIVSLWGEGCVMACDPFYSQLSPEPLSKHTHPLAAQCPVPSRLTVAEKKLAQELSRAGLRTEQIHQKLVEMNQDPMRIMLSTKQLAEQIRRLNAHQSASISSLQGSPHVRNVILKVR